jgi:hypothetical protein
LGGHPHRGPNQ